MALTLLIQTIVGFALNVTQTFGVWFALDVIYFCTFVGLCRYALKSASDEPLLGPKTNLYSQQQEQPHHTHGPTESVPLDSAVDAE